MSKQSFYSLIAGRWLIFITVTCVSRITEDLLYFREYLLLSYLPWIIYNLWRQWQHRTYTEQYSKSWTRKKIRLWSIDKFKSFFLKQNRTTCPNLILIISILREKKIWRNYNLQFTSGPSWKGQTIWLHRLTRDSCNI